MKRNKFIRKAGKQRRCDEQEHDCSVHREHLVVLLFCGEHVQARCEQLRTNEQRHHSADEEVHHRGDEVEVTNDLVVSRGQPANDNVSLGHSASYTNRLGARSGVLNGCGS